MGFLLLVFFLSTVYFHNTLAMESEKQNFDNDIPINNVGDKNISERLLINEYDRKNQLHKVDSIGHAVYSPEEKDNISNKEDFTTAKEIDYLRKESEDTIGSMTTDTSLNSPMKKEKMVNTKSEHTFPENTEKNKLRKFSFDYHKLKTDLTNSLKAKFSKKEDGCGICFQEYHKSKFKSNKMKKKIVLPCCSYHMCVQCRENCVKRDAVEGWVFVLNHGLTLNEIVKCFKCPNCRKLIPQDENQYKLLQEMQNDNICIKLHEQIIVWQKAEIDSLLALMVQAKLNNGYYVIIKDYISQRDKELFQLINNLESLLDE